MLKAAYPALEKENVNLFYKITKKLQITFKGVDIRGILKF